MSTSNRTDILSQYIYIDQIPKQYGGKSPHPLLEHPLEFSESHVESKRQSNESPLSRQKNHQSC